MFEAPDGKRIRFWIDPPYPDETTSSVLDRAAAYCVINRAGLTDALLLYYRWYGRAPDWDFPDPNHSRILSTALGIDSEVLPGVSIWRSDSLLAPLARSSYCPRCFIEDLRLGRTPYFRWHWAVAFVTLCPVHNSPLFDWKRMRRYQRVLPYSWTSKPRESVACDCSWLVHDLKEAEIAEEEMSDAGSAIARVWNFQKKLLDFSGGPSENWERRGFFCRYSLQRSLALATNRVAGLDEPVASIERPLARAKSLFASIPKGDRPHLPRNAYRKFTKQRLVGWRRSILFNIALCAT